MFYEDKVPLDSLYLFILHKNVNIFPNNTYSSDVLRNKALGYLSPQALLGFAALFFCLTITVYEYMDWAS